LEQPRGITNEVWKCVPNSASTNGQSCQTNKQWLPSSDSDDQIARFSSRGNVGIGLEGPNGRFKPDVVAPGSAVVSTRSANGTSARITIHQPRWAAGVAEPGTADQLTVRRQLLHPGQCRRGDHRCGRQLAQGGRAIYIRQANAPTTNTYDFRRTNHVSIPPDTALNPVNTGWFYGLGKPDQCAGDL